MKLMVVALTGIVAVSSSGTALSARVALEYSCRSERTAVALDRAREASRANLFNARLQRALATGQCRVVRFVDAGGPVLVGPPRRAVAERAVAPVYAAPVYRAPVYREPARNRFPTPSTFQPVR